MCANQTGLAIVGRVGSEREVGALLLSESNTEPLTGRADLRPFVTDPSHRIAPRLGVRSWDGMALGIKVDRATASIVQKPGARLPAVLVTSAWGTVGTRHARAAPGRE
jgi:hypothetical protein